MPLRAVAGCSIRTSPSCRLIFDNIDRDIKHIPKYAPHSPCRAAPTLYVVIIADIFFYINNVATCTASLPPLLLVFVNANRFFFASTAPPGLNPGHLLPRILHSATVLLQTDDPGSISGIYYRYNQISIYNHLAIFVHHNLAAGVEIYFYILYFARTCAEFSYCNYFIYSSVTCQRGTAPALDLLGKRLPVTHHIFLPWRTQGKSQYADTSQTYLLFQTLCYCFASDF